MEENNIDELSNRLINAINDLYGELSGIENIEKIINAFNKYTGTLENEKIVERRINNGLV